MNRDHSPLNLSDETLLHVSLEQIIPNPKQPRKHFSQKSLLELAKSIRAQGILQPLVVRKHQNLTNRYELVAGERRWRALKQLEVNEVPVVLREVGDDEMLEVCNLAKQVGGEHNPFEIKFKQILFGPPGRPPRMIWLAGEKSDELARLRGNLEGTLLNSSGSGFNSKIEKAFNPHITLARIKQSEWKELAEQPKIKKEVSFIIPVEEIKVMESRLSRGGAEYSVLESIELGM